MKTFINTELDSYLSDIEIENIEVKEPRDLKGYKLSMVLCKELFNISKRLPLWEQDDLAFQIRKISKKLPAQIAEGNGNLYSKRELYFLGGISLGSICEIQAHLDVLRVYELITDEEYKRLDSLAQELKKLLIGYSKSILKEISKGK